MGSQLLECSAKGFLSSGKIDQLGCYPGVDNCSGESVMASGVSRHAVLGSMEGRFAGRQGELAKRMKNDALGYRQISHEHPRMPQLSEKNQSTKVQCVLSLPSPSSSPTRASTETARNWFRGDAAERPARHGPSRTDDSMMQIAALQERIQGVVLKIYEKEAAAQRGRRIEGESIRPGNRMIAERLLQKVEALLAQAVHERQAAARLPIKLVATLKVLQMECQLLENTLQLSGKQQDGSYAAKGVAESVLGVAIPDETPGTSSRHSSSSDRNVGGGGPGMGVGHVNGYQIHAIGKAMNGKSAVNNGSANGFHANGGFSNGFTANGASNGYHSNGTANGSAIPGIPSYQPSVPFNSEIFEKQKGPSSPTVPTADAAAKARAQSQTWLSKMLAGSIGPGVGTANGNSATGSPVNGRAVNGVPEGGLITNGMPNSLGKELHEASGSRGDTSIWGGWDRVKEINEWWDHETETNHRAEALRSAEMERKAAVMHTMDMAMREGEMERLKKELARMHHDMELLRQAEAARVAAMEGKLKTLERELAKRIPLHAHEEMVRKLKGPLLEARAKVKGLSNEVKEKEMLLASMKKEMSIELVQQKGLAEGAAERTVAFLEKELAQAREQAKSFAADLERREKALVKRHEDWARERSAPKVEPTGVGAAFAWVAAVVVTGMIAITF